MPVSSRPTFHLAGIFGLIFAFSIFFALLRFGFLRDSPVIIVAASCVFPFLIGGAIGWAVAQNLDGIIRGVFGAYCFPFLVGLVVALVVVLVDGLNLGMTSSWSGIPADTFRWLVIALIIAMVPFGGWIGGHWAAQDKIEGDL